MKELVVIDEIKEKVKTFINDTFLMGSGFGNVGDDDSLLENGIIDSTGILELVSFIEETYAIGIEDEEMVPDNLDALNRLALFISRKTNASG